MDYQTDKRFGQRLKEVRDQQGLTQEQLSAMLQVRGVDLTRSALAKIEVGQRHIYLDELRVLKEVLHVSYEILLDWE